MRKRGKRTLALLMTIMMVLTLLPISAFAAEEGTVGSAPQSVMEDAEELGDSSGDEDEASEESEDSDSKDTEQESDSESKPKEEPASDESEEDSEAAPEDEAEDEVEDDMPMMLLGAPASGVENVTIENTPFVGGSGESNGKKITKLNLTTGTSFDLNLSISGTATWSSADTSIATVNANGNVTGVAVGETVILATVGDNTYSIPVSVIQGTTSSARLTDVFIPDIQDTIVYSNFNFESELKVVQAGELYYYQTPNNAAYVLDFFAAPINDYALTGVSATNTALNYHVIHTGDHVTLDTTSDGFYGSDTGNTQREVFSDDALGDTLKKAAALNCDAALGFTRRTNNTGGVSSNLSFVSEKLPTVTKEKYQVNGQDITDDTIMHVGDIVTFKITVEQYATQYGINYENTATLTDTMEDNRSAHFQNSSSSTKDILSDLSKNNVTKGNKQSGATLTYYVDYTLTKDDLDILVKNTIELSYGYKSAYSTGTLKSTSNATVEVATPSVELSDIVIDFGLPVEMDYSDPKQHGYKNFVSGSANFGEVSISNNVITYTPTKVLTDIDEVTIVNESGVEYQFQVIPATTVYYEEGFASYGKGWLLADGGTWTGNTNKGSGTQEMQIANASGSYSNYGYDPAYGSNTGASNGTVANSGSMGDALQFTFTGTGTDIFATTSTKYGLIMIRVTDAENHTEKMMTINIQKTGDYGGDEYVDGTSYNTPVASISGLTQGTHIVTICNVSGTFEFDGFRVYNTMGDNATAYEAYKNDLEENPSFHELRNAVLGSLSIDIEESQYAKDIASDLAQAYENDLNADTTGTGGSAVLLSNISGAETDGGSLLDNGPKNELYIKAGQSVVFNINTARQVQIGMRSMTGSSLEYQITNTANENVLSEKLSSVDMFYDLHAKGTEAGTTYTITVTSGVLSITDLKVSDSLDSESLFGTLTEDDFAEALVDMGYEYEETPKGDATLHVNLVDYTGQVLASETLTENGELDAEYIFNGDVLTTVAENLLPSGYAFVNSAEISDTAVKYGEEQIVQLQIGKVATLKVTYKTIFGRTKGTAILTAVQTSKNKQYTFNTIEIRRAAPKGVVPIITGSSKVKFGSTGTKTVSVW